MASAAKFSYQRLRHEGNELDADEMAERLIGRSRTWYRLKRVPVRKRFRLKVPSLKRFLRRKVKLVRLSFAKLMKRLKESQAHFGDLFAGNYMFIQVNPTTMKCFEKSCEGPGLKGLPSSIANPSLFFTLVSLMSFLFRSIYGPNRTLLRALCGRQFSDLTGVKAKRNYADNVSEYNTVLTSLVTKRRLAIVRDMTADGAELNKFCYAGLIVAHMNKMPRADDIATRIIELAEQSKGWSSLEASGKTGNAMLGISEEELYNLPTAEFVHRRFFLYRQFTVYHVAFHACADLRNVEAIETLLEMLKKDGKTPDTFITMQSMRCYLPAGDIDRGVQIFEDYLNEGKPPVMELYATLIVGAMIGFTPRGMQLAQETLVNMNSRNFFLNSKVGSDLLLAAAGEKARNALPSLAAVEAYYKGLKEREIPEDDPRLLLVSRTLDNLRSRFGIGHDEHQDEGYLKSDDGFAETDEEAAEGEEEKQEADGFEDENGVPNSKKKTKEKLLKEAAEADNRGVCYLSTVPPHMDHVKLRQLLSQSSTPSKGWAEFARKWIAKRVANMLNGEQIGGRKRSSFYYDLWNIKYLSKFKWDHRTEEIAYKSAIREQKLALEFSAAKRERDFYLSKVDQSRALSSIEERMKKKQKVQQESGTNSELPVSQKKVIRQFPQKKPVAVDTSQSKPRLSKDILAGVSVS
ncbi:hypothetical protein CRYUN_Cryun24cG0116600 [Craigia yunnanensis]